MINRSQPNQPDYAQVRVDHRVRVIYPAPQDVMKLHEMMQKYIMSPESSESYGSADQIGMAAALTHSLSAHNGFIAELIILARYMPFYLNGCKTVIRP